VSGDVRPHPVAFLAGPLFGRHNRQGFEVFVYSTGPGEGSVERARIAAAADVFCDASRYDGPALAQRIAANGIDILVDLSGYTLHARSTALALRPAPVQVSYLGYLGSMGADWIDYALLDRRVMADAERPFWSEAIAYLPHCLFPCDDAETVGSPPLRSDCGLPESGAVFACFNASWKVDPASFGLWMQVLQAVEGAVLWLVDDAPGMAENLRREAEARGVASERLVFAPRVARPDYLARLRRADIFLDTLPYNANTTGIDALLAGVPLVTLPGDSVAARGAGSLLAAHGLSELVAGSAAEYVALAVRLAKDGEFRKQIREKVARRDRSNLFGVERRVQEIERAYNMMWERHQAGLPPADFDVPPLD
jgi:predicted O-linked N-acetylglucosamine transferase (SPINDLY family)